LSHMATGARGSRSQRVLMVLYHFPPLGGVSMPRAVRNVQYLPSDGWTPVVLTPRDAAWEPKDPSSVGMIPSGLEVIRTGSVEAGHLRPVVGRLRSSLRIRSPSPVRPPASSQIRSGVPSPGRVGLIRQRLFFPDDQVGWVPFAVLAALRAHRRDRFNAIFSTSFPISAHLVAGAFKRLTGIPWVAEFRDPWVGNALTTPLPWVQRQLQLKMERWIVQTADRVVCVTPRLTRMYQERYPGVQVDTIPNGYDRSESVTGTRPPDDGCFRLVYTGTLYRPAELEIFLTGLDLLLVQRPDLIEHLQVTFYGLMADVCKAVVDRQLSAAAMRQVVRVAGFVPRHEALAAVAEADAALVLLAGGPGMDLFVGGKLYDYLGQDCQIFAMVPPGDARDVLSSLSWGVVADPNPEAVAAALRRLIELSAPARPADPTGRFDRVKLASMLAGELDAASSWPLPRNPPRALPGRLDR
jgi:glycosyltransferase involved in cell wall biosynthesis